MIGKLTGIIDSAVEDTLILDVQGVGYQLHVPARLLQAMCVPGRPAVFFIETFVREDQIRLFGFLTAYERAWFRLLMRVQGVGARLALAILGCIKPLELADAVAMGDTSLLLRSPGVGKKVAERLLSELKDKLSSLPPYDRPLSLQEQRLETSGTGLSAEEDGGTPDTADAASFDSDHIESAVRKEAILRDVVSALVHLGYDPARATSAARTSLRQLSAARRENAQEEALSTQALIRHSLKELAQ